MNPVPAVSSHYTALRCLFILCMWRGVQLQPEHFTAVTESDTLGSVLRVAGQVGLHARVLQNLRWRALLAIGHTLPVMAALADGRWILLVKFERDGSEPTVAFIDPSDEARGLTRFTVKAFRNLWTGTLVVCRPAAAVAPAREAFGLSWFLPELLAYRGMFRDVALAALMSALIAFATPLLFQILIDKVITHRSYQTLTALMLIFGTLTVFDGLFAYVRQYLMTVVTSKIDARLATRTFRHMLSLPLRFFETTTTGILTRHLQQTDTIRQFLTGRLFHTALDAMTLPLLLLMLLLYSVKLTLIVLSFSIAMALIIAVMLPTFRRQLERLYRAEGARQGHLVETIHGMRTVKSLGLEPVRQEEWNAKITASVQRRARVGRFSALAAVLTQTLDRTMQISVLGVGAIAVFDGTISIGALVAFNMISGRVTGPLVQIVGLINEYQETSLAVKMLGTVMDHPPERDAAVSGMRPTITGALNFDRVSFRYHAGLTAVLDRVSFTVSEGQVIGIVGRSGSGKTTITRLIQGMQMANEGVVRLDGVDLRHIDLAYLRRNIGVVLQENFLFRGSVRENIAAARPQSPLDDIVEAARLAGAEEFIDRLPHSYETIIEENGANFSGGQRQRIAIARALLTRPRLLIFDEATSALDPESEAIVQANLEQIARGRTLIIVSHRLTSLAGADAILVLEAGRVVDFAPHATLLHRCEVYAHLWQQQTKHFL